MKEKALVLIGMHSRKWLSEKMGIKWASKALNSVTKTANELMSKLSTYLNKVSGQVIGKTVGVYPELFGVYSKLPKEEVAKWVTKGVNDFTLKYVDKFIESNRDKGIEEVLKLVDQKYGSQYAEFFRTYISLKKLSKIQTKLSTGNIKSSDVAVDAAIGDITLNKPEKYAKTAKKLSI
jgi:hypothetical protein